MVGLSEKQHLAEAPWQRRTVGVPWQRRLAEAPGRGARRCVSPWHPPWHPTVDVPWQRQRWVSLWQRRRRQRWVSPGRGAWQRRPLRRPRRWVSPWQRRLAFDGGCLHGRSAGVRRWVSHGRPGVQRWVSHGRPTYGRGDGANGGCPLAEAPGRGARRWVSPWHPPTVGVPWQRRLAFDGGCPHGRSAGVRRWVSHGRPNGGCPMADPLWQRRRRQRWVSHGRGAWRSTVGVPWQTQRWVSHGRPTTVDVLWQRQQRWMSSGRGRSAWQRRRWVSPWQRHGSDQRWVSPWPRRSAAVGVPYVEAHTWRRVKLPFFRIGVLEPP